MNPTARKYLRNAFYGFLAWLVPFVAAFAFYTREGTLMIEVNLFKSIMIVVGSGFGAYLLIRYFKRIDSGFLREGIVVGIVWFAVSIVLDLLILIPMSGMSVPDYFAQIGLRYLAMPAMSIAVGACLAGKKDDEGVLLP